MSNCNICGTEQTPIFTGLILHKYTIQYFQCPKCGFISTEKPHWLEEAYSDAIADSDTGYAYRNLDFAKRVSRILKQNFKKDATFLDYGAGYGLFVRLMRDNGFNFHYYDLYCNNIFAKGLELPSNHSVDAYTALEVFEHLEDPTTELETMLKHTDTIIFSTVLRKEDYTNINQWWYFTPETGQHIAIFTKESLAELAKKFNLNLYTNNKDIHILTKRRISWCSMKFDLLLSVIHQKIEKLMYRKRTSLLQIDYQEVKRMLSESSSK
jgi:hypothetical protein